MVERLTTGAQKVGLLPSRPLGTTQWIGFGALIVPFAVVTLQWFRGEATYADWANFLDVYLKWALGTFVVAGAGLKGLRSLGSAVAEGLAKRGPGA